MATDRLTSQQEASAAAYQDYKERRQRIVEELANFDEHTVAMVFRNYAIKAIEGNEQLSGLFFGYQREYEDLMPEVIIPIDETRQLVIKMQGSEIHPSRGNRKISLSQELREKFEISLREDIDGVQMIRWVGSLSREHTFSLDKEKTTTMMDVQRSEEGEYELDYFREVVTDESGALEVRRIDVPIQYLQKVALGLFEEMMPSY